MFGMDLVSLLFLGFMVVVSGFVAYAGDLIGRSLGKRRLTFMGLRPRHTAAVMTGVFGGLATLLAVVALVLVSEPVRTWVFEGNKARGELAVAKKELDETGKELSGTKANLAGEQKRLADAGKKVAASEKEIASLRGTAATLTKSVNAARTSLAASRRQLLTVQTQYRKLLAEADALGANNKEIVRQNKQIAARNIQLEISVAENEGKIQEQTRQLSALNKTVNELQGTISGLQERLATESTRASAELKKLADEIDDLGKARDAAEAERVKAVEALEDANALYRAALARYRNVSESSRKNPITYQIGDELARIPVRSGLSGAEARAFVLALLESADSQAKSLGAGQLADGRYAGLVQLSDRDGRQISAEMQLQRAIEDLSGKSSDQVIVANSYINTFRSEPVAVVLTVRPNPVVYQQAEVVGEVRIDGRESERVILDAINEYVSGELSDRAIRKGMIPATGKPQPLGVLESDALIGVVRQTREAARPLRLMFLAAQETKAADRLKLELRLR